MKLTAKALMFIIIISIMLSAVGCSTTNSGGEGEVIIEANKVTQLLSQQDVVLVDMQETKAYNKQHIKGAVNIRRSDITINEPVSNMLAPKEVIEEVLGKNGISNNTTVVIYDNSNNMDAARLWWTLKVYGHDEAKVVSGGLKALQSYGAEITDEAPTIAAAEYTAQEKDTSIIATFDEVKEQVDYPKENVVLLDVRTQEEYNQGTIPSSILVDYTNNNYNDGTYKSVQAIKLDYLDYNITPDKTIIMYCKTSIRAAQTYLALYNAGYRNMKIYDGAWLEWIKDTKLPVQKPSNNKVQPSNKDNS